MASPRTPSWLVYVLRCGDGTLYTGATNDLDRRLARHGAGRGSRYTRSRLPVKLVHQERCRDKGAALRREAAIKVAEANYEVAVAKADADHKVAIEKCEALAGDSQDACKSAADAARDAAKSQAKATLERSKS